MLAREATTAEEYVATTAPESASLLFEATTNLPGYVEWLLSKGCHKLLRLPMGVGATPLGSLVNNQDADLSVMPILVAADPEFTVADKEHLWYDTSEFNSVSSGVLLILVR